MDDRTVLRNWKNFIRIYTQQIPDKNHKVGFHTTRLYSGTVKKPGENLRKERKKDGNIEKKLKKIPKRGEEK